MLICPTTLYRPPCLSGIVVMSQKTVSLQIPPDAQAGDTLSFDLEGTTLELCVPQGAQPGDVLEVQLNVGTDTLEEETKTNFEQDRHNTCINFLGGSCLEIFSAIPGEIAMEIPKVDSSKAGADGTHAHIWPAAKSCIDNVLASPSLLAKLHDSPNLPARVLELGSGTGLLGMAYCTLLSTTRATVVLSDCLEAQSLLRHNLQSNRERIPSSINVECQALDWREGKAVSNEEKYDLILGSDLLYNTDKQVLQGLAETIEKHLKLNGKVLLSTRWRKPELERIFFHVTTDWGIEWSLLYTPRGCDLTWDEFGNPNHDASNEYFLQRSVAVNGELLPLAEIDEACMEKMSDGEHEVFEQSFLQVYVGKRTVSAVMKTKKRKFEG